MQSYRLAPHVHMCFVNGHVIFLDLRKDHYSALDRTKSRAFTTLVNGQTDDNQASLGDVGDATEPLAETVARDLVDRNILTLDSEVGRELAFPAVCPVESRLLSDDLFGRRKIRPNVLDVYRFFSACIRVSLDLRYGSIWQTVNRVRDRKNRKERSTDVNIEKARHLVAVFDTLRPFYHRDYLCLFDSLALVEFLAAYGQYPTWVYGVKAEPFHAHCWVEEKGFAFNEAVDTAHSYAPIMTV